MKQTLTCPACQGRKIWHVPQLMEQGHGNMPRPLPISVAVSWLKRRVVGKIEAFVCASCGFIEHYAYELDELGKTDARLIDGSPEATLR
jgi:hypothetical protein